MTRNVRHFIVEFSLFILLFILSDNLHAYSNKLSIGPSASFYFVQEPVKKSYIFAYGGNATFEYDLSNKFNLLTNLYVERPVILGSSNEFVNEYFFFGGNFGFKFYPTAVKEIKYIQGEKSDILVEHRRTKIMPFIAGLSCFNFFINDSQDQSYANLTAVGIGVQAGFDIPSSESWGTTIYFQGGTNITPLTPLMIFLNYHMGFAVYFAF